MELYNLSLKCEVIVARILRLAVDRMQEHQIGSFPRLLAEPILEAFCLLHARGVREHLDQELVR